MTLSFPIALYANNKFYCIHTITTSSMEPSLQKGDVILIRKVDFLPYYQSSGLDMKHLENLQHTESNTDKSDRLDSLLDQETDRLKALKVDASVGRLPGNEWTLWREPPNSARGDVVAVQCPESLFPGRLNIARLVGLGSQRVSFVNVFVWR